MVRLVVVATRRQFDHPARPVIDVVAVHHLAHQTPVRWCEAARRHGVVPLERPFEGLGDPGLEIVGGNVLKLGLVGDAHDDGAAQPFGQAMHRRGEGETMRALVLGVGGARHAFALDRPMTPWSRDIEVGRARTAANFGHEGGRPAVARPRQGDEQFIDGRLHGGAAAVHHSLGALLRARDRADPVQFATQPGQIGNRPRQHVRRRPFAAVTETFALQDPPCGGVRRIIGVRAFAVSPQLARAGQPGARGVQPTLHLGPGHKTLQPVDGGEHLVVAPVLPLSRRDPVRPLMRHGAIMGGDAVRLKLTVETPSVRAQSSCADGG